MIFCFESDFPSAQHLGADSCYIINGEEYAMRKLKIQVQMSIDGYISGVNGELDWLTMKWDNELRKYVYNLNRPVDCIIMGKNFAGSFIDTWEKRLNDPDTIDSYARKMVETPKIVFSRSLEQVSWKNTHLNTGYLDEEISRIKKIKGRDIIAYGGITFVSSLIRGGHVDEYNFFVNPVILGKGRSIFSHLENMLKLELVYSTHFDCGITALCYVQKKQHENSEPVGSISGSAGN